MKNVKVFFKKVLGEQQIRFIKIIFDRTCRIFTKGISPFVMPIMKFMATSGEGTNTCLKHGFLPIPVHYYQPIPDISDLEKRRVWDKESKLGGINFEPHKYLEFFKQISREFNKECNWPNEPSKDPKQFHLHNSNFSYGCAAPLHCIIRHYKPKRIIEIGSGNSSKIIAAAIELNGSQNQKTQYTIIDPYSILETKNFPENTNIIRQKVEIIEMKLFESLEANDILFIDSSHVSKIGSDVNFEILEILPILNKGVLIHFHDINLPYEYPKIYATNPKFRVFWNESYLLQAFLICNSEFEIILPMDYLQRNFLEDLKISFPLSKETNFGWVSGSFWIKRISKYGQINESHNNKITNT
jgi:hypothetical protein